MGEMWKPVILKTVGKKLVCLEPVEKLVGEEENRGHK